MGNLAQSQPNLITFAPDEEALVYPFRTPPTNQPRVSVAPRDMQYAAYHPIHGIVGSNLHGVVEPPVAARVDMGHGGEACMILLPRPLYNFVFCPQSQVETILQ